MICFYANPATPGSVERHVMSPNGFHEAQHGANAMFLNPANGELIADGAGLAPRIAGREAHLWTLSPPKGARIIERNM